MSELSQCDLEAIDDNQASSDSDRSVSRELPVTLIGTYREVIAAASAGAAVGGFVGFLAGPTGGIIGSGMGMVIGATAAIWNGIHQAHLKQAPQPESEG